MNQNGFTYKMFYVHFSKVFELNRLFFKINNLLIILFRRNEPIEVDPNSGIGSLLSNYPANPTQHPEFNKISSQLNNVIAFVNPKRLVI